MVYGAVIVAAGLSSRMQNYKPLMKIGDKAIAERIVTTFQEAGVLNIVMVTGYKADLLEEALKEYDITFIRNEHYEQTQMFDSAKLGFDYLKGKADRVFFCPVDIPLFSKKTLIKEMEEDAPVVIPVSGGRKGHPVLIRSDVYSHILKYDGDGGMRGAFASLPEGSIAYAEVSDEGILMDADTREDYEVMKVYENRLLQNVQQKV